MRPDVEKRKDNIGLLVFLCIFAPVAGLMYAAQERYPKDNKLRVRRIYSEINEMIRPHTVFRDWSSTRAGTSLVKFTVKGKPEDLEALSANFLKRSEHFHFHQACRDGEELLYHHEAYSGENYLVITWTYPSELCVGK